ncbi:hypothetical protein [Brevundimonas sp.]|uniref:hypothetical protein n=1 Tax=Brevundimonas sp. TaxID=1871086 RepID=UPI0035B30E3D
MLKPALFAVLLAMAGPSAALGELPYYPAPSPDIVDAAPPEYWSPPDAPAVILFGSPAEVDTVCRTGATVPEGYVILACTSDTRRVMLMPNPCLYQHEYYAKLMCHEQAHLGRGGLSGWKH